MARVIDASAAVALIVESPRTQTVRDIFSSTAELAAPDILIAETTNAIWNHRRTSAFTAEAVGEFLERLCANIAIVSSSTLVREAYAIAMELNHPVYDALYLALAKRDAAQIVTFDECLVRKVAGTKYESLVLRPSLPSMTTNDSRPTSAGSRKDVLP
jgi:predicted nucleic acid-binding protein